MSNSELGHEATCPPCDFIAFLAERFGICADTAYQRLESWVETYEPLKPSLARRANGAHWSSLGNGIEALSNVA